MFVAKNRKFKRDLHVPEPAFLASRLHKLSSPILYFLIQEAHKDRLGIYSQDELQTEDLVPKFPDF